MIRKIISRILNLILFFIILGTLLYTISSLQALNNPTHIPSVLGFTPLTVVSGSMSPGIQTGDLVVIRKGSSNINPGDIVTYKLSNVLVTHRVKEISKKDVREVFVTQGDANGVPDYKTVDRNQIVGKYVLRIPFGGYLIASLRGLPGILIILGLGLIVLMIEVLKYSNQKVKEAEESL